MENRVKILIADGNEEFCGHVKRRLEQVPGYEIVGTAADGQRAVELMRVTKPDILVLDLMLSKLDGIAVLKKAREMDKPPAALVLTGFMTEYVANMAASLGVQYFMAKPEEAAREQGETLAARIVADAVQRCAASHVEALATTTVTLPNAEMKGRIVGRDGRNVRAFESATGVQLLLDDAPDAVVLSAFDPLRREIARRALVALVADGRIHPASIESAVATAQAALEQTCEEKGTEAAAEADVPGLPAETLRLMGALHFRLSLSQNVLRHSVEVAILSGAMAAEMKLDGARARRIGFLHDIGKAITAEKRGAHAALGAEFLLAHGEDPKVCAAVAAPVSPPV